MARKPKDTQPFGSWPSPITASMVARSGLGNSALPREVQADESGVYWIESRPQEAGRYVIQHLSPSGSKRTLTPDGFSVRTKVHEYGGGSYLLWKGSIFFSNEEDQRLYRQDPGKAPRPISPEPSHERELRFANGTISPDGKSLIYICEEHSAGDVKNYLALLSPDGLDELSCIQFGADFYANPRFSPDGAKVIWLSWDLPHMPWEGTELWMAHLQEGKLIEACVLAGGLAESIFQPEWGPNGDVLFVSDRTGWWNLYRWERDHIEAITQLEVEFGLPMWTLSTKTYTLVDDHLLVASYLDKGQPAIAIIDLESGDIEHQELEYSYLPGSIESGPDKKVWFLAGSPYLFPGLSCLDMETREINRAVEIRSYDLALAYFSFPEHFSFKLPNGAEAYAHYYPPAHPEISGLPDELPPLIVKGHGGPTSAAKPYLNLEIQFWTSRGFAVVDVDYSGSSGYGRKYRDRLKGQWGIVDVNDCVEAARYLAKIDRADPERLLITGGSAGGYIVLSALTKYDRFAAGASYYGVADILSFVEDTHKFEAGYDTYLIGSYPEFAEVYHQRSPINHADRIKSPVILFQGLEDKIVPPSQSEVFVEALKANNIYHKYITFEGEGHGFRRAESISIALEAELKFYREVLKISASSSD